MSAPQYYSSVSGFGSASNSDPSGWSQVDIAKLCEHVALNICPTALLIASCPFHLLHYNRKPRLSTSSGALWSKLSLISLLFLIELARASICRLDAQIADKALIASTSLACIASLCIGCMLFLEHRHATQSSFLISLYLTTAIGVDFARACVHTNRPGFHLFGTLSAVTSTIKLSLVIQQEVPKQLDPPRKGGREHNPEKTAGFWNRTLGLWLSSTFFFGFRNKLRLSDLPNLGEEFSAARLSAQFREARPTAAYSDDFSLMEACFWTLRWPLLSTAVPRLCLTLFTFALAYLIELVIQYIGDPHAPSYVQTALVAGVGVIHAGIAVSRASTIHRTTRLTTFLRGILISEIFQKNLKLPYATAKTNAALTLMNKDVDGALHGMRSFNDVWISVVEAILVFYNLSRPLGFGVLVVLLPILTALFLTLKLTRNRRSAIESWNEGIQNRVARMTISLSQMKAIKMLGLEPVVARYIQRLRLEEIAKSEDNRKLIAQRIAIIPIITIFTQMAALAALLWGKSQFDGLDTVTVFRVLVCISLLNEPVILLVDSSTVLGTMGACFARIQDFLLLPERQDHRELRDFNPLFESYLNQMLEPQTLAWDQIDQQTHSRLPKSRCLAFLDVSVASNTVRTPVLRNLQFSILSESLIMIIGPIASGKSALLKTILGEAPPTKGAIHIAESYIAFCDQKPWIPNMTIREIIVGECVFDGEWYARVIYSCVLNHDIEILANGDRTLAGINGAMLSGGQKQRIATARAVYARRKILVLDDILSALDRRTANLLVTRLLGPRGLLKKHGMTAVLATNSVEYLNFADTVFVLDKEGRLTLGDPTEPSQYKLLSPSSTENSDTEADGETVDYSTYDPIEKERIFAVDDAALPKESIQTGFQSYKMLFRAVPQTTFWICVACHAFGAFAERGPDIYIMRWAQYDPSGTFWFTILILFGILALFIDRKAGSIYLLTIVPLIAGDLHELFLDTVMKASIPFLTSVNSGLLLNRFSQDMTTVGQELPMAVSRFLYMCVLIATDTIVIAGGAEFARYMIPIIVVSLWYLQQFYLRTSRQLHLIGLEARSPLFAKLSETIMGLEHIRAFGWQDQVIRKSLVLIDRSQKSYYYEALIQRWLFLILDVQVGCIALALVAFGVKSGQAVTETNLALALLCTMSYSLGMRNLIRDWATAENLMRAIVRLKTFAEQTPVEQDHPDAQALPEGDERRGRIELRNAAARYTMVGRPRMAIEDVNLSILDGQHIGVIGRTGSGKSSLILTFLNALEHVGSVRVNGVDITRIPRAQLRNIITTIPQETIDLPGTVRQNLLPRDILNEDQNQAIEEAAMVDVLRSLELYDYIVARGGVDEPMEAMEFSAGQKQLIGVARGMLHHMENSTRIVLMDEPTSNIDAETNKRIQKALAQSFENCTKIVISHREDEYRDCDVLLEMVDGRIINHVEAGNWRSEEEVAQRLEARLTKHGLQ